ncbi:MAG: PadR family transcriptional regulator [Clostridia bacterium]|nr:PadR family transcriptional regulator [Clostridia bacterium]
MDDQKLIQKYLPLSESTYYILLSLVEPLHGYGIMQKTQQASNDSVKLGPGTLYGALSKLEKEDLISMTLAEDRRKNYQLTPKGKRVLYLEIKRLEVLVNNGAAILDRLLP